MSSAAVINTRTTATAARMTAPAQPPPQPRVLPPMDAQQQQLSSADEHTGSSASPAGGDLQSQQHPSGKLLLGQVRKNGFGRPFARDQVISWTGHSVSAACFYAAAISLLVQGEREGARGVHSLVSGLWSLVCCCCVVLLHWQED